MSAPLAAVGVVVPVHDEEASLGVALAAVAAACRSLRDRGIPLVLAIALDRCSDSSAEIAERCGHELLGSGDVSAVRTVSLVGCDGNVGMARRAGVARALAELASMAPEAVWLATTDADSRVPPCWLDHQLERRAAGYDAWAGTVTVRDWPERPGWLVERFAERYRRTANLAGHVHGTSLGFNAGAYLAAGGFLPLATGEDRRLWRALGESGARRFHDTRCPVVTSARRGGRAPHGFAAYLDRLEGAVAGSAGLGASKAIARS